MSPAPTAPYDEQATLNELVFALGGRDEPTVALVECASLAKRRELEAELARRMPEYRFYQLDVTPYAVTSLLGTLTEHLPAEVRTSRPVAWVVNVHGLENSRQLNPEGQLVPSPLTVQLNLERELLFRRVPYLIVLWGDADFFLTLQREAPDFWHWVTYRFRFEDHTARAVAALPPLPPERLPGPGNVAERQARIAELRERYDHLALDDSDKKRLLKDKIDILSLLGAEYKEAFLYDEAADAYRMAIALQERMRADDEKQARLWFELGAVYLLNRQFSEALNAYEECKKLVSEFNIPIVFHEIGRVHYALKDWATALTNYQHSLRLKQATADYPQMGRTYHQIGLLYEEQGKWELALNNYHQALKWKKRTGDTSELDSTYYQIGMTYYLQKKWVLSLNYYQQALSEQKKINNEFGTGNTYYSIGLVYRAQRLYVQSLSWIEKAIMYFDKYGDPFLSEAKAILLQVVQLQQKNQTKNGRRKPNRKKREG